MIPCSSVDPVAIGVLESLERNNVHTAPGTGSPFGSVNTIRNWTSTVACCPCTMTEASKNTADSITQPIKINLFMPLLRGPLYSSLMQIRNGSRYDSNDTSLMTYMVFTYIVIGLARGFSNTNKFLSWIDLRVNAPSI